MNIVIVDDYDSMSRLAADKISDYVNENPQGVLGLATGSTPIGTYKNLVEDCTAGKVNFSGITTFNLDEYVGLNPKSRDGYRFFMNKNLFNHINIDKSNTHVPDGMAEDLEQECRRYDAAIADAGGLGLQLLGLGHNGHIGFNEPNMYFPVRSHVVDLAHSTIAANSRLFDDESCVPRKAVTMGIGTIMLADQIVVIVSGEDKAEIVRRAFVGPVSPDVPASALRLHKNVTVICDKAAAKNL